MHDYDVLLVQRLLERQVDLPSFCFHLAARVRRQYGYHFLSGDSLSHRIISLLRLAQQLDEIGEVVWQLAQYWEAAQYDPYALARAGVLDQLAIYEDALRRRGDSAKADAVRKSICWLIGSLPPPEPAKPPGLFICYSRKDEKEKDALEVHLRVPVGAERMEVWSDADIGPGGWEPQVFAAIDQACVAVLLITPGFLTSWFILEKEVPRILERQRRDGLVIVPIIAKPVAWETHAWLKALQVWPRGGEPVWRDGARKVDTQLADLAREVARLVGG